MPRPALTEEQRRAARRRLRHAAAELHAEQGLAGISARAVAELAGVSVGSIYSHFGTLAELMQSLWRQPARRLVEQLEGIATGTPEPVDRLRAMLVAYVDFAAANDAVFRAAFLYVRPPGQPPPQQVALADDRLFGLFRTAIKAGQASDSMRAGDPDQLAQLVLSGVHGALALPVNLHRLALEADGTVARRMVGAMVDWVAQA